MMCKYDRFSSTYLLASSLPFPLLSTGNVDYMLPQPRDSLRDLVGYSVTPVPEVIIRDIVEIYSCFLSLPCGERKDAWVC